MLRKLLLIILLLALFLGSMAGYMVFISGTGFKDKTQSFIIREGQTDKASVLDIMEQNHIFSNRALFSIFSSQAGVWNNIKPGKYEVTKGQSMRRIAGMLKNGRVASVKLVINKVRTKADLAKLIGKNLLPDSVTVMNFLSSNDSLAGFKVDTNTVFTLIIPDTYAFYWDVTPRKIFQRLFYNKNKFWDNKGRLQKAAAIGFTPEQVYILASIVEEETNYESDKYKIASVYINRLNTKMPLQACPTIKYAMNDFTLTRIYEKYLFNPSPYNTYRRPGLPPGPICTPSPKTIDIILDAPKTDYLFFVAKSDFSGYHHFSNNFKEHSQYAKEYQKKLDEYMARKQEKANQ